MIQVINGIVVRDGLPTSGYLSNGESVSGYNLLSESILRSEGWLPRIDNIPDYNIETQFVTIDSYTILENEVIVNYKVIDIEGSDPTIS